MKNLTLCHFFPLQQTITRYFTNGVFRSDNNLRIADLEPHQQAIVTGAMTWALAQLPDGFTIVSQVEVRKTADVVLERDENGVPTLSSPAFETVITGYNSAGEGGSVPISSIPGPETNGLDYLWGILETQLNTPSE